MSVPADQHLQAHQASLGGLDAARIRRVSLLAGIHVVGALILTLLGPLWLLLLAPLLLGVPHVASDLRHLVLRPPRPIPRALLWAVAVPFAAMTAMRVGALAGLSTSITIELLLGALAVGMATLWSRGHLLRQIVVLVGLALFLLPALLAPGQAALTIGHAHNLVAIGLWVAWMGPRSRGPWLVVGLSAAAVLLLLSGIAEPFLFAFGALEPAAGLGLGELVATLAPDIPAPWDLRLVLCFALLQAVHYSMWIWCIPQACAFHPPDSPRVGAWRRWLQDLGLPLAIGVGIASVVLPMAGVVAPTGARAGYLSLVLFHGWLELAIAAHLLVRPRATG